MHEEHAQRLAGVWKLVSAKMVIEGDGESREAPTWSQGTLIHDPSGTMAVVLTAANREPSDTEAGRAALYQSMLCYSGTIAVEADRLITQVEVASWPEWVGTAQTRFYKLTDAGLSMWTETRQPPAFGGQKVTGYLDWVR